ncbi:MAG: GNAT family N-acetyltransferase [Actinobacteria bacterium]|nr:MAG: GNAT family N-acetyltransferase [Actinomycetota bacterium]
MTETSRVGEPDLQELLPLVRAYCDFYEVAPTDEALLAVSRVLIADPDREGVQVMARDNGMEAVGFATVYWSWDTLIADRVGIMHDLFVRPPDRGTGVADLLIDACVQECRRHGAAKLGWQTARDNARAQAVYRRVGATRDEWVDYWLAVSPASS